jgi:hypothetical protein
MRPIVLKTNGVVVSPVAVMDIYGMPEVSLQFAPTGTATCSVEQTLDDPFDPTITPVWLPHPDTALVGATAAKQGNYAFIPRAIRLNQTAGAGSARLTIVQAGSNLP